MRWPNLGLLALIVAAGGLATGPFLSLNYAPTLDAAHDSVSHIENDVTLGWLLRGLHHWSANFALVLAALHGWRLFWKSAYRRPRRTVWVLGCAIFLVIVGFGYTGYLLTGDERAYTGLGVMERVASLTPLVGEQAAAVLKGAPIVSSAMLTRIYVIHSMILPAVLAGLAVAFFFALRKADLADGRPVFSWGAELSRDAVAAIVVCAALAVCAVLLRPTLGPKPDFAGTGAEDARPEWFFLWVNLLMHKIPATFLIGAVLPGAIVGLVFVLPWISRGRGKVETVAAVVIVGGILALTAVSVATAKEPEPAPEEPATASGDIGQQAWALIEKKCASCHTIDGAEEGGTDGPQLNRNGFSQLYTKRFFRLKVKDPAAFWEDTSMRYRPKKWKPSDEQVELLVKFFFGD